MFLFVFFYTDDVSFWFQRNHTFSRMEDDRHIWNFRFHDWNSTHGNDPRGCQKLPVKNKVTLVFNLKF